jgi:integral membrane sensor domain MASE1
MMGRGSGRGPYALEILAVGAVYYGAAKLGLQLAFTAPSVTAVWPPTGIALAAIILLGYRVWPGVALGAFAANVTTGGVPLYSVAGITCGNTLEALAGAYLLCELADFRPTLHRVRDVFALVVLAGLMSTTISATIGATSLLLGNEIDSNDFGIVWRTWWLGDMGGDLVVAPALLVAATQWPFRRAPGRVLEAAVLAVVVGGAGVLAFRTTTGLTYLVFPPLIWAAMRFWQPGAVSATLLLAAIAIPLTEHGYGPYSSHTPDDRLLLAQTFIGVAGITVLLLAAVITERREAEEDVEQIAETLQESLLPTYVPEIPGIETAVDFRAAGKGQFVGGDFYDIVQGDDGSWSVVVGDVVGKGAAAAAATGLARYTMRAAAVEERSPSRILEALNTALLRQSPDQLCTVAYARLEMEPSRGARVTLAVGGHPLPLVLRADGTVEAFGEPGALLGMLPDPGLRDHAGQLSPGDALVLYTDGLTEAHAPYRIVQSADLAAALRACAGLSAAEIRTGLEDTILRPRINELRDDIVLLVLRMRDGRAPETS